MIVRQVDWCAVDHLSYKAVLKRPTTILFKPKPAMHTKEGRNEFRALHMLVPQLWRGPIVAARNLGLQLLMTFGFKEDIAALGTLGSTTV